jgi:choline dehydrogenase
MTREEFDYIVVGGGSAGCVAAARLVHGGHRVLLLEGGHSNRHPLLDMPAGIFKMINGSKFMHYHTTEPQEHLGGRAHDIPQMQGCGCAASRACVFATCRRSPTSTPATPTLPP